MRLNPRLAARPEKRLQPLVSERLDHGFYCKVLINGYQAEALDIISSSANLLPRVPHPFRSPIAAGGVLAILRLMCAHYDPLTDPSRLRSFFDVDGLPSGMKPSLWPAYVGPFVRKHEFAEVGDEAVPFRELLSGFFGLIPHWSKDAKIARRTYNARSETVHEKPSYRDAWRLARRCVIPAEAIFEPDWRSGKAVATRISRADGKPMGIAGLWAAWQDPAGGLTHSYTMLTMNAVDHPFMRQYHKPEDEKRMVVILQEADYDAWLRASVADGRAFLRQFDAGNLAAESAQRLLL